MKNSDIPVFILAGGLGTRLSEETQLKPKPMVEIGEVPLLIHLMRWYHSFGFNDFVICAGYRSWEIKQYILNYEFRKNNLVIDHRQVMDAPPISLGRNLEQEKWRVRVIDTGAECMTGGRIARAFDEVAATQSFGDFALTYGDGLSNVNLDQELTYHRSHQKIGTVLGAVPPSRWGELSVDASNQVRSFIEKPSENPGLINGGFFFFKNSFRQYVSPASDCVLEQTPLVKLAAGGELMLFKHSGFWQPMDTVRDKMVLEGLWNRGEAPWKIKGVKTS